jgi:hypothetical protein
MPALGLFSGGLQANKESAHFFNRLTNRIKELRRDFEWLIDRKKRSAHFSI